MKCRGEEDQGVVSWLQCAVHLHSSACVEGGLVGACAPSPSALGI